MKSVIVPRTSVPPATETVVVQMTYNEAKELIEVCETYHHATGSKTLASVNLLKHLTEFIRWSVNHRGEKS